ncbi:hypothetical protein ABQZ69_05965 [Xanthomonas sp. WHRI 8391]|nr:hypothetical protein [Xanthomonas hortorum]
MSITTLAALASAGVLRAVQLVGQVGGYTVMVRVGQTEKQLTGQRVALSCTCSMVSNRVRARKA